MKTFTPMNAVCVAVVLLAAATTLTADRPTKGPPSLIERLERTLKGEDKPFALVIQIYLRPGSEGKFEAAAAKAAKASAADEGCLAYDFERDLEKPGHYVLIERWTGLAALRKHLEKAHTKQIQAIFAGLGTGPRTVEIFAPVPGKA
jgi:quinol monooxygenase YgiN